MRSYETPPSAHARRRSSASACSVVRRSSRPLRAAFRAARSSAAAETSTRWTEAAPDEEAGLRPFEHVHEIAHAAFLDLDRPFVRAPDHPARFGEAVLRPEFRVVPLDDRRGPGEFFEGVEEELAALLHAERERRPREDVAVAVDDRARQAVALTEGDARVRRDGEGRLAEGERPSEPLPEEGRVDLGVGVPRQEAHGDERFGVKEAESEHTPVGGGDLHHVAALRRAGDLVDLVGENPRIAPEQGLVLVAAKGDTHDGFEMGEGMKDAA